MSVDAQTHVDRAELLDEGQDRVQLALERRHVLVPDRDPRQRADAITDGGYARDIVFNAPLTEDHYFLVPKVVE
jgi:Asp-tRNA(Asn)/Glu-tRNA(Gln) amidotransferase C subunit